MAKTFLVHGLDGASPGHWQQWWAETDPEATLVDLTDPRKPVAAVWEYELAEAILHNPGCIVVGHSLGSVLIARVLVSWPHLPVAGALLVAPTETEGDPRTARFGPIPEEPIAFPTLVVASRNDPRMSHRRAAGFARLWGSTLVEIGDAGHINAESGYGPWPAGMALRDHFLPARPLFAGVPGAAAAAQPRA
jgi:hypothetical protein